MATYTMTQIQEGYIAKVLACATGHIKRVRRGARSAAFRQLTAIGYSSEQCCQIMADADDMIVLTRSAAE